MAGRTGRSIEDRGITLLFVNCTLSRHFVMSLLKAAAKNSYFSFFGTPIEFTALHHRAQLTAFDCMAHWLLFE